MSITPASFSVGMITVNVTGRGEPRGAAGWRIPYPDFFGSLNMKYMTITTVAQKTTCLCQNKTSP
jgi:hypothetical protein